jgi:hypothetical protein
MMQRKQQQHFFSATDLADYEYCSLAWWHDQFEPLALANTEELFALMVEMEEDFDTQAPLQPEYQVIEQLLQRRGAFDQGQQQHQDYADSLSTPALSIPTESAGHMRRLLIIATLILLLAIFVVVAALVFR